MNSVTQKPDQHYEDEPVYEGEIINTDETNTAVARSEETPPTTCGFAYNLGKFTGWLISSLGCLGEALSHSQNQKNNPGELGRHGRRNRRQRKGKRYSYLFPGNKENRRK
jgi:hypothetical protein